MPRKGKYPLLLDSENAQNAPEKPVTCYLVFFCKGQLLWQLGIIAVTQADKGLEKHYKKFGKRMKIKEKRRFSP